MRQIVLWLCAVLASLTLAMSSTAAHAEFPARPNGPVLDAADILPDADEAALIKRLNDYNKQTGRALMVVTIPSLEGEDIATYGSGLGRAWGVGGKESDQGLIVLVALNERKTRIEVGYGLETYLPDVLAGQITRDVIRPKFKAGDFPGGINAAIDAITAQLNRDPADAKAVAEAAAAAAKNRSSSDNTNVYGVVFWIVLIVFMMFLFGRRGRRGMRHGGIDPGIVLWGVSEILHHATRGGGGGGMDFGGGGGGGSDWGGFGGGDFGGGGASGDW